MKSSNPWDEVVVGQDGGSLGRLVSAATATPIGRITVVGVCIPWKDAHVRTGRSDREPWEDHVAFIHDLHQLLSSINGPIVVLGDFNQRIPRGLQPARVFDALVDCFHSLRIVTAGAHNRIDHIALTPHLSCGQIERIDGKSSDPPFSDHDGVVATVSRTD